jgi:hypothetical protein
MESKAFISLLTEKQAQMSALKKYAVLLCPAADHANRAF